MDDLIQLATALANQPAAAITPIPNRVAYVVSHGQSYASNGYAIRTQGIAQALNQHGFETLCFVRPGRPWELGVEKGSVQPEMLIKGVRYIHSRWQANQALGNEANHLEQSVARYMELFRVYRPAAVLAASNYIVSLPAWVAAKRLGLPFYNEVRGFWELSRDAREPGYAKTPNYKAEYERDTFVAKQACKVFTLNQPMKGELVKRGIAADNIELVPNGVSELPTLKPARPALKQKLGIEPGDKVVGYVGSFSAYEGLDVLLEACTQLVQKGEKLKLLLVGDDQPVTDTASANKVLANKPWLIQVGRVPHEQVADYYALIDAIVIPRNKLPVCELMPPMKAAEALAYGKRLVISDVAPLAEYAQKYDGVVSFEVGKAGSLAQALQKSLKLPAPKASESLLFSVHTEPMVFALKGEGCAWAQNAAAEVQTRKVEPPKAAAVAPTKPSQEKAAIKLTRDVTLQRFDLNGDNVIRILGNVSIKNGGNKAGVLLVELFDKDNKKISPDDVGLPKSEVFGGSFMYLQDTKGKKAQLTLIDTAKDVAYAGVGFTLFQATDKTEIEITQLEAKATKFSLKGVTASPNAEKPKHASDYKVAIIADEFTSNSFSGEFQALPVEPDNWLDVFQDNQPDIFFCESAWAGPDPVKRPWRGKVYASINFPNENRKTLLSILEYCKKAGVPTVFWNKEDPTHHNDRVHDFVKTASLFDYVFTTAEECVESYKTNYGVKNVFALPFGTNPRLFNPVETSKRTDHVVFAGSWYENHTERCKEMRNILDRLLAGRFKLDIYNRYHGDSDPLHIWPEKYSPYLLPAKPHHEMPAVYKSSVYGLNFNTVTSSSTMFARRVFELMSSNTLVVSNYSQGVDEMFGNLVVFPDRDPALLKSFTQDEVDSIRHKALHEVLEKHTYKQRWRTILQSIGLPYVENDTTLTFTYVVKEREEASSAISWFQQYGTQFSGSRLLLVTDISMDPLDVAKFYQEFNRFGISVTSMLHAEKYAIPDRYRPVETSHFVALSRGQSADAGRVKEGGLHLQYMTEHLVALAERPDQRHKTSPATADAVVMGSASQFTDWMQRQTKNQISTVYWV
jgi:glycosyltransferase involved in cell wall biosynthesis/spore maturation protein CgeB